MSIKTIGRFLLTSSTALIILGSTLALPGCEKRSKHIVEVSYVAQPKVGLPEGLQSIAFVPFTQAIKDKENIYTAKERKWGDHIVAAAESRIEKYARQFDIPLDIVDRESVAAIMKEKDLADSGLAEENLALQLGKLAKAQAICYGTVVIDIETIKGTAQTVKLRPSSYGVMPYTETKTSIKRTINVAASFKLIAVATGQSLLTFTKTRSETVERKPGAFMGSDASEIDLGPEHQAISALIDRIVEEFVAQLMPHKISETVQLASSDNKLAKTASKLIMTEEYDEAISLLNEVVTTHSDDHAAWYNLGVAYELNAQLDKALQSYKAAYRISDKDLYLQAHARLKKRLKNTDSSNDSDT